MKGVVVGLNSTSVDVVWDVPFMGGETLGGRCSEYHGSTVPFSACLNLSNQQFKASIGGPATTNTAQPFVPRLGPHPVVPSSHFRPAANQNVAILNNPNRVPRAPTGDLQYGNATKGAIRPPRAPAQHVAHDHRSRMASALVGANGLVHPRAGMSTTSPPAATHTSLHHAVPAARGRGRGGLIARGGAPAVGVNGESSAVNGAPAARGRGGGRGRGRGRGGAAAQPSAEAAS
jgi:5'-3' exoribonuclease 1